MNLTQRNNIMLIITILIVFVLILLVTLPYLLYKIELFDTIRAAYQLVISSNYIYGLLYVLFSIISLFFVRFFFYKTSSIEIYFFMLFLASAAFDSSRSLIIVLQQFNPPDSEIAFMSRLAYFGKIFGGLALFCAALSSSDIGIKKLDTSIIVITTISYLFSSSMALSDITSENNYFLPCYFNYFLFSLIAIKFLAIVVFTINFFQKKNINYLFLAISILLIALGREFSFYKADIHFFVYGFTMIIAGTILFVNRLHEIYNW